MLTYLFRKKRPEANSFEQVFEPLIPIISRKLNTGSLSGVEVEVHSVPHTGASPSTIFKNIRFTQQLNNSTTQQLLHITGEIHYCAIFSPYKKTILTIHDAYSALTGNWLRNLYIKIFWFWLPALFVKAITTISEQSASEIKKLIPFAKHKIHIIPNPYNPEINMVNTYTRKQVDTRLPVYSSTRLLFIGTKPNKNLERTITALSQLNNIHLTILGKLTEKQEKVLQVAGFRLQASTPETQNRTPNPQSPTPNTYTSLFNLPFQQVINLYHTHSLMLFPSLYEGFGMPIIEANAAGLPVITSNLSSMPEVASNAAHLVDPYSIESISAGVEKVLNDKNYQEELVRNGYENIKRFEVERVAEMYVSLYEKILNT